MLSQKEQDMIDHVNESHIDELLWVVAAFTHIKSPQYAQITHVEERFLTIDVKKTDHQVVSLDVPFTVKGDLDEKAMLLFLEARQRLGIKPKASKKRYFEVKNITYSSKNILSLTLKAIGGIEDEGKLTSARFVLKKLSKLPKSKVQTSGAVKKILHGVLSRIYLAVIKKASPKMRRKLVAMFSSNESRTYTYKTIGSDLVTVDVFLHGNKNTPANLWALSLQVGDIVRTASENRVDVNYLQNAQAFLCADETGFPAVSYLLSKPWNTKPIVFILSKNEGDVAYFDELKSQGFSIQHKVVGVENQAECVIDFLQTSGIQIDASWAGLEMSQAKKLKVYLKNTYQLKNSLNNIKPYWVKK